MASSQFWPRTLLWTSQVWLPKLPVRIFLMNLSLNELTEIGLLNKQNSFNCKFHVPASLFQYCLDASTLPSKKHKELSLFIYCTSLSCLWCILRSARKHHLDFHWWKQFILTKFGLKHTLLDIKFLFNELPHKSCTVGPNMRMAIINYRLALMAETQPKIQYNSSACDIA